MTYGKILGALAGASLIAGAGLIGSTAPADAQWRPGWRAGGARMAAAPAWRGGGWRGNRGWGGGGAVAAGLIGGLALGAIAASAAPAYAAPVYGYDDLPPGYVPAYGGSTYYAPTYYEAAPRCWWQRQRVRLDPWTYQIRRVRVCR